ncbi:MLO-like protein 14 [Nymphaea thermarum]|nr:MLO-like protein 14 [Nymphaea thermarum]
MTEGKLNLQLVLLVGTKLQHVIATLALENAGITGSFKSYKVKPRDDLFWFRKPEMLLSLIHFVLFQSHRSWRRAFFVDRSSWKLPSLNAVEVPASVFRLQPIRAAVLLLGTPPPRDPCRCLGFSARRRLGIRAVALESVPQDSHSPWDPCPCVVAVAITGVPCAVDLLPGEEGRYECLGAS